MTSSFKLDYTFAERSAEAARIKEKYIDRVPIVVERGAKNTGSLESLDKKKYLCPADLSLGQFLYVIRKRLHLPSTEAIFLFTEDGTIPSTSALVRDVYLQHKDQDGFMYLTYQGENVFG